MTETTHNHSESDVVHRDPPLKGLPINIWTIFRYPFLLIIRLYQATFSKALPENTCRYYPTCSHYGYQAIYKYGAVPGGLLAFWRILRCNPFSAGGIDPVPDHLPSLEKWFKRRSQDQKNTHTHPIDTSGAR